jgi:hypothetical protein
MERFDDTEKIEFLNECQKTIQEVKEIIQSRELDRKGHSQEYADGFTEGYLKALDVLHIAFNHLKKEFLF